MPTLPVSLCDFGPPPACPDQFNLAEYVLTSAGAAADKVALTVVGGHESVLTTLSYGDLQDRVLHAAGGLAAMGLGRGDRVILRIGHQIEFPIFYLATAAIGAVPVPTSPMLPASYLPFPATSHSKKEVTSGTHRGETAMR